MSSNPPTRPGLTEEQFAQLSRLFVEALGNMRGGASVSVTDPRLTKAIIALLSTVGSVGLLVSGWLVMGKIESDKLMERVVTIQERQLEDMAETKQRISRLEERKP